MNHWHEEKKTWQSRSNGLREVSSLFSDDNKVDIDFFAFWVTVSVCSWPQRDTVLADDLVRERERKCVGFAL